MSEACQGLTSCRRPLITQATILPVQAYQEIEQRLVSETVFSQYMYKTLPSCNHLWAFKKQFCCQMALSGGEHRVLAPCHDAHQPAYTTLCPLRTPSWYCAPELCPVSQ